MGADHTGGSPTGGGISLDPIGGIIGGIGNLIGGISNAVISAESNELSKEVFEWQKKNQQIIYDRADTAYQRRALDLKAAGINPMLAAGAQPSNVGHSANVQAPKLQSPGKMGLGGFQQVLQSMAQLDMTKAQADLLAKQKDKVQAETDFIRNKGVTEGYRPGLLEAQTGALGAQASRNEAEVGRIEQQAATLAWDLGRSKRTFTKSHETPSKIVSSVKDIAGLVSDTINEIRSTRPGVTISDLWYSPAFNKANMSLHNLFERLAAAKGSGWTPASEGGDPVKFEQLFSYLKKLRPATGSSYVPQRDRGK